MSNGGGAGIRPAYISGLGLSLPRHSLSQEQACEHAKGCCCKTPSNTKVLERIYRRTEISSRSIVLQTSLNGGIEQFYPGQVNAVSDGPDLERGPSTGERMHRYEQEVIPLAFPAAKAALHEAGIAAELIRQLITVSCTGFFAPGFDLALMHKLELHPGTARTHVGFMGCHGSLNALRVASAYCGISAAPVLICAAELCSLHFQYGWESNNILANSLFSDGAAALVLTNEASPNSWRVVGSGSFIVPNSADVMTWTIGDNGFAMTLSPRVVELLHSHLKLWIESWLHDYGFALADINSWAIHPGGPRILDAVQDSLGLTDQDLLPSRTVFAECGNMSSPTVLFILERLRGLGQAAPCVILGFGPGLAIEAALLV
jgi:predicted naringenin-chalcone synthase